jgi:hypothetical protein
VASNGNIKRTLGEVLPLAESLPLADKAELVQRLIGEHSGLNVVIDSSCLSGSIIGLVNLMSRDEVAETLIAIANRVILESKISRE